MQIPDAEAVVRAALGEVARMREPTDADRAAATMLGGAYQLAVEAGRLLLDEGAVVAGKNGPKKNPRFQVWRDSQGAFRQWACEFGLTPAASMRVARPEAEELTDLERMLRDA